MDMRSTNIGGLISTYVGVSYPNAKSNYPNTPQNYVNKQLGILIFSRST